jgi:hypothetical protein
MRTVGIDPGASGAVVLAHDIGDFRVLSLRVTPVHEVVRELTDFRADVIALEHVSSSPRMGVASAFAFGRSYGMMCAAVHIARDAHACEIYMPTPRMWQQYINRYYCPKRPIAGGDKGAAVELAGRISPRLHGCKHDTADAFLLAVYARLRREGEL